MEGTYQDLLQALMQQPNTPLEYRIVDAYQVVKAKRDFENAMDKAYARLAQLKAAA